MKKLLLCLGLVFLLVRPAHAFLGITNYAYGTLGTAILNADSTGATFTVTSGTNAGAFPASNFNLTVYSAACSNVSSCASREVINISSVSGTTFTISARNQEGTTHSADWAIGSKVAMNATAAYVNQFPNAVDTDSTFATNSDSKVPSQKAVKTALGTVTAPSTGWTYLVTDYFASDLPIAIGLVTSGTNTVTVDDASSWANGMGILIAANGTGPGFFSCDHVTVSGSVLTMLNANGTACNATASYTKASVIHTGVTTGTISSGSNSLAVAANSGATAFSNGQGVVVEGAGTAGADLICPNMTVSGTTLTLLQADGITACNAATSVTSKFVHHDDTQQIKNAMAAKLNIHFHKGSFYTSSSLTVPQNYMMEGEGNFASVIIGRSNTTNVISMPYAWAILRNFGVMHNPEAGNPTAGACISVGTADTNMVVEGTIVENMYIGNCYHGYETTSRVLRNHLKNSNLIGAYGASIHLNTPVPYGDQHFDQIEASGINCILIEAADTQNFMGVKCNAATGQPLLKITAVNGDVNNLRFTNCSFEASNQSNAIVQITPTGHSIKNTQFTGGEIGNNSGSGVGLQIDAGATNTIVTGVMFTGLNAYGIQDNGNYGTFTGNTFDVSTTLGISLGVNSTYASISGNTMNSASAAITINSAANHYTISNNTVNGASLKNYWEGSLEVGTLTNTQIPSDDPTTNKLHVISAGLTRLNLESTNSGSNIGIIFYGVNSGNKNGYFLWLPQTTAAKSWYALVSDPVANNYWGFRGDGTFTINNGTAPALSTCGTGSPALATGSDNFAGKITLGTGSPTACTLTFASSGFTNTPACTCTAMGASTSCEVSAESNTAVTFTLGATATKINYHCIGLGE